MKHFTLRFLAIMTLVLTFNTTFANSFTVDNINYEILTDNTVEVLRSNLTGDIVIPESVNYNGTTYSVTSIGYDAFFYCRGLTSVTIPNNVTSIGVAAFCGCSGLTSITIPNSVTSIGKYAFDGCSGLASVTIPNSVTSIGDATFFYCRGLTSITIPNSVTSIGNDAFDSCSGLASITIPNSVTSIGNGAFESCSGLTSATIPNSVTSIGDGAFVGCGLTSVTIPNSVTSIECNPFWGCADLKEITVNDKNTNYASVDGVLYSKNLKTVVACPNAKSDTYIIPNCVTTIRDDAFRDCRGLTSITIPNSVTSIGNEAFYDCSGLASITIPNSITSIGDCVFYGCTGLTSITIPNSVTSIEYGAFENCSGLTSIYCEKAAPLPISYAVFENVCTSTCTLYVPTGSLSAYKTANVWKDFLNIKEFDPDAVTSILAKGTKEMNRYDINGKKLNVPVNGVNILRMSDGTTKKVIVR